MYSQEQALVLLKAFNPQDESEKKSKLFIEEFVRNNERYWSRETLAGHLTGSAWITNKEQTKAVLLHHKKLNIWVQPGGHIDDADESLPDASYREAMEETGLTQLIAQSPDVFDLDVHKIPARKSEPEHWHLDVRFWYIAENTDLSISEESNELAWLTRSEIEKLTDEESVLRMVRKTLSV
jgi:ADP-ribose pyrophosphatase YjhB (NUDIX family)